VFSGLKLQLSTNNNFVFSDHIYILKAVIDFYKDCLWASIHLMLIKQIKREIIVTLGKMAYKNKISLFF